MKREGTLFIAEEADFRKLLVDNAKRIAEYRAKQETAKSKAEYKLSTKFLKVLCSCEETIKQSMITRGWKP